MTTKLRKIISLNGHLFAVDKPNGGNGGDPVIAPAGEILFGNAGGNGVTSDPDFMLSTVPVARPTWVTDAYGSNPLHSHQYSRMEDTEQIDNTGADWGGFSVGRFEKLIVDPAGEDAEYYSNYIGAVTHVATPSTYAGAQSLAYQLIGQEIVAYSAGTGEGPGILVGSEVNASVLASAVNSTTYEVVGIFAEAHIHAGASGFVVAALPDVQLFGTATVEFAYANYAQVITYNTSHVDNAYFYYAYKSNGHNGNVTNGYVLYSDDQTGFATNSYFLWNDSPGVFRVKADGVMAYYNANYAKYTPGAKAYERVVQQWNGDVAEYGPEAGPIQSVTSITRSSAVAIVTLAAHKYRTGDSILIAGANETEYNGAHTITVLTANTFTYAVSGTPASPATGTLTAKGGTLRALRLLGSQILIDEVLSGKLNFLSFTNVGLATETATYQNTTTSTGITNWIVKAGAANSAGGNPYMFQVQKSDATFMLGVSPLGIFANTTLYFGDSNADYPVSLIRRNSYNAIDFVAINPTDNAGHGAFNFELSGSSPYAYTSGTGSYMWFGDNSGTYGYTPTSGTGVFNGLWINWLLNQTGGASGITRGIYVNPILIAVADYRGLEIADAGTTQTALKTGTGLVQLGGQVIVPALSLPGLGVPDALTAALITTGTGNIGAGAQTYKVTFVDINGKESPAGISSNTVTTDGSHKQVALSNIPIGPTGTVARNIYRSDGSASDQGFWSLAEPTINDNTTTTYTDNVAWESTVSGAPFWNGIPGLLAPPALTSDGMLFNYDNATATTPNLVYDPTYGTLNSGSLNVTATGSGVSPRIRIQAFDISNNEDPDLILWGQGSQGLTLKYNGTAYLSNELRDVPGGSLILASAPGGLSLVSRNASGVIRFGVGATSAFTDQVMVLNPTRVDILRRATVSAPDSAIADGEVPASAFSFYLNESGNALTVKVKYANGTTIKTGTIALT